MADIFCGHAKFMLDWERVVRQGKLERIQSTTAGLDHCLVRPVIESPVGDRVCLGVSAAQVAD